MNDNYMISVAGIRWAEGTIYIPERYNAGGAEGVNLISLVNTTYTGYIYLGPACDAVWHIAFTREHLPFVWVKVDSPSNLLTDAVCNVELRITRSLSVAGWVEYGVRVLFHHLSKQLLEVK